MIINNYWFSRWLFLQSSPENCYHYKLCFLSISRDQLAVCTYRVRLFLYPCWCDWITTRWFRQMPCVTSLRCLCLNSNASFTSHSLVQLHFTGLGKCSILDFLALLLSTMRKYFLQPIYIRLSLIKFCLLSSEEKKTIDRQWVENEKKKQNRGNVERKNRWKRHTNSKPIKSGFLRRFRFSRIFSLVSSTRAETSILVNGAKWNAMRPYAADMGQTLLRARPKIHILECDWAKRLCAWCADGKNATAQISKTSWNENKMLHLPVIKW